MLLEPSPAMKEAEAIWNQAVTACHGPVSSVAAIEQVMDNQEEASSREQLVKNVSLRAFMDGLVQCADPVERKKGGTELFSGEWCVEAAHYYLYVNFAIRSKRRQKAIFVEMARCALQMEYPLLLPAAPQTTRAAAQGMMSSQLATNRQQHEQSHRSPPPKRVILLALTLGPNDLKQGCKLVTTAYPRGWDIVLVKGIFRGLKYKFSDALEALRVVFDNDASMAEEDTLILFVDASDVLLQRPPADIIDQYMDLSIKHSADFFFSSESSCFPIGMWPHSMGVPHHICNQYPESKNGPQPPGRKYVNTGGWIGRAPHALVVLKEIVEFEQRYRTIDSKCHKFGTDQLFGNVAYLRNPTIGMDVDYQIFASNAWDLVDNNLIWGSTMNDGNAQQAYCFHHDNANNNNSTTDDLFCPALLHFNGGSSEGGTLQSAWDQLLHSTTTRSCENRGSVSIVDRSKDTIRKLDTNREVLSSTLGSCLHKIGCF